MFIPFTPRKLPFLGTAFIVVLFAFNAKAQVPENKTFKILNAGFLGEYESFPITTEYNATYRVITNQVYDFHTFPFRLCFYNTTPASFVLGIRAGDRDDESLMRWVWDANRNHPVGDNAALSFGRDGNLVLFDSDGSLVWQTGTGNRGVTGIKLLQNGNLVLYDKKGKFIWQSFDHPVDTLLAGMSVSSTNNAVNKLVSRNSDIDGSDGKYSLVHGESGLLLYMSDSGRQIIYNGWPGNWGNSARFSVQPTGWETPPATTWDLRFQILVDSSPTPYVAGIQQLSSIKYNATYSFLRIESDGNVKAYTYYDRVRFDRWVKSFAFFSNSYVRECGLPTKCGSFGLCDNGMCIGCPTPKGILGWTENCQPPKLKACRSSGKIFKGKYYKVAGAESFMNRVWSSGEGQEGPMKLETCRDKCSNDCNCKGFVYKEDTFMCFVLPVLGTLVKFANTSSVYVKY
ncbi:OLC1v1023238C1 [Oldenlandia corymbosa var. corymbosa]|uniref:OLC1v1023238C1 n=1 Tax=Oldenlandia corymbosa var. corymbosa TaxID=529605 RepID=A0AAV1BZV2_OLDCO|nr:OLC1v1023238C1 [Oldenlandia corymbosa var. corymbosa]